jgi:osmotically-inducible protein OsmY
VEDQLTVEPPGQGRAQPAERAGYRAAIANSPAWITTKIHAQYFLAPEIKPWNIDVTTSSGGIVELRGELDDPEARAEAVRIAGATEGVTRVEDHLRVRGQPAVTLLAFNPCKRRGVLWPGRVVACRSRGSGCD